MSSRYPILGDKPIDQWKVTALKEELKKRRLAIKGLKDDLIRRLDDALRVERENDGKDVITGDDLEDHKPEDEAQSEDDQPEDEAQSEDDPPEKAQTFEASPVALEVAEDPVNASNEIENTGDKVQVDIKDSAEVTDGELLESVVEEGTNSTWVEGETAKPEASENRESEVLLGGKDTEITETLVMNGDSEPQLNNENLKPELDGEDSKTQLENEGSKPQLENEDPKPLLESEDPKPELENVMVDSSSPNHQVSEVSLNLGFQVKSDSISTDSVSISEKIEIKDNIISDNVKLELDDVKPEMVEPSTDNHVPVVGESHPMDVEEPQEKMESLEEKDDSNADLSKKNDILDVGYSEKLNLDRSSGDDSMEEDVVESKQIDSKYNPDDAAGDNKIEESVVKDEILVDAPGSHMSTDEKKMHVESQTRPSVPPEKRKLNDQEAAGSTEPLKRQRKWNTESLKVPEPQSANLAPTTTPKGTFSPTLSRRNFSRSDSTVSNEDPPKERVVPPSQKPPTNSLRIDRFLRPFTIKAVQELLGKTGTVTSFWMDHIKTHCYVSYSSPEEAIETRNALYNLQWPSNGGRLLVAEFVDPQEVRNKAEAPPSPAAPVTPGAPIASPMPPQPSPRQQISRQQLPPPPSLPPPPPLSNPPPVRERLVNLPPHPPLEKLDPPIVTLDDLFRKTRATPRIYYLPLTEEQVAVKLERGKSGK